ncbi:MAG: hypothetical protein Q8O10_06990 [candidate division Zixibacteria bacterium]|nr:hypothetical protein [candidate division Zixibacteria bacterium]
MDTQKQKIKFYLDKNIWSHRIMKMSPSELEDFKNLLGPLREQSKIEIYYSPINVLELIKGMKLEEYFEKCREEISLADRITNKHFLEYPYDHVRRSAFWFLGQPFKEPDLAFLNLCRKIAISSSYQAIEPEIQPLRDMLNRWVKDWADDLNSVIQNLKEKFNLEACNRDFYIQTKKLWENEVILDRKQKTWVAFCRHFSLPSELKDFPLASAYDGFHSFRYWVDYRLRYESKLIFDNRKAEPSDYFDWLQIVYLNVMDYLVTEDEKLRTILKECDNEEMHRVAMSFDEFIGRLSGLPPKRAPDTTIEKWYDAH